MKRPPLPGIVLALAIVVGQLGAPAPVLANMANPWRPGDVVGEPTGALKSVAIEREDLAIDLRPLAAGEPARVTATYQVRNDGPAQRLSLLFVAAALAEKQGGTASVWLDGAPIPSRVTVPASLPETWQPPETTPALDGGTDLSYMTSSPASSQDNRALEFALDLPVGRHEIRVSYPAAATAFSGDSPVRYWQLGYVLAPARDWASFDKLEVRVDLPAGWSAASEPSLSRSGDVLSGTFDAVPADALALTARAPVPTLVDPLPATWLGGLLVSLVVGALVGHWLARLRRRSLWALGPGFLVGVAWMIAVIVAAGITYVGDIPPSQHAWTYGYGQTMVALLTSPFALLGGLLFTQLAAVIARRSVRPPAPKPTPA